jgi:hypothetical protein
MAAGVTYEQLTGDLSRVNFSSMRGGRQEFRALVEIFRWLTFIPMACRPVAKWWLDAAYLSGKVRTVKHRPEWTPPRWEYIQPWMMCAPSCSRSPAASKRTARRCAAAARIPSSSSRRKKRKPRLSRKPASNSITATARWRRGHCLRRQNRRAWHARRQGARRGNRDGITLGAHVCTFETAPAWGNLGGRFTLGGTRCARQQERAAARCRCRCARRRLAPSTCRTARRSWRGRPARASSATTGCAIGVSRGALARSEARAHGSPGLRQGAAAQFPRRMDARPRVADRGGGLRHDQAARGGRALFRAR